MSEKKNIKVVSMAIDSDLYEKSESIIQDRTRDYEEYLHRVINAGSSTELIRAEIEDLEWRIYDLKREYELKIKMNSSDSNILHEDMEKAVKTVTNIIESTGSIGTKKLREVAKINNVLVRDLKNSLPEDLQNKITKYHLEITMKPGTMR